MPRNQGFDQTIDPAYLASMFNGTMTKQQYLILLKIIQKLYIEVDGTQDQEFKDGLMYRTETLENIVDDLVQHEAKVYYNTTEYFNNQPTLLSERGSIYIYSDAKTFEGAALPRIKVGTGNAYLIDLHFIDDDIVYQLAHIDTVSPEEKQKWNNKVTCYLDEDDTESLVFSKD